MTAEPKEVANDALREIYEEAEPGLDFDHVLENPDEYQDDWYDQHFLEQKRQRKILDKHLDKYNLTDQEKSSVTWTVILHYGPRGFKEEN